MARKIEEGDEVAYSGEFLKSTGQHTGNIPAARGVVMSIVDGWLAVIFWQKAMRGTTSVNVANLARVGSPAMSVN